MLVRQLSNCCCVLLHASLLCRLLHTAISWPASQPVTLLFLRVMMGGEGVYNTVQTSIPSPLKAAVSSFLLEPALLLACFATHVWQVQL